MSTDDLVDAEKLSNVIAVVIGIGIAAEALVEAFFDFFEYVIVLLLEKTLEDLANKTYVKFKKFSTLFFCLGFGIGIGSYVVKDDTLGYALGALGGLTGPISHMLVQAGFQGKEFLKKKAKE